MTDRLVSTVVSLFQTDKLFGALALQCPDRMSGFIGCLAQNMREPIGFAIKTSKNTKAILAAVSVGPS